MLASAGLRRTACRVAVLRYLATAAGPLNHAEVSEALSPEGFDKSTVYRSLVEMAAAGLIKRFELGDHVWRFALHDREHNEGYEHPHFVCVDCGTVSCLPDTRVRFTTTTKDKPLKLADLTDVVLHGHCDDCRNA